MALVASLSVDAVHFECDFLLMDFVPVGEVYTCNPIVTLTGSTTLANVTGDHEQGFDNDDVGSLWLTGLNLPFFPSGIADIFPNLRVIEFWGDNIHVISNLDLQPFPQLVRLVLTGNNFTSLDGNLFSFNPLLEWIGLSSNRIQHIGEDFVANLSNLQFLGLIGNVCVNENAETRDKVLELAVQLLKLCPPLEVETTTENPIKECSCDDIEELREENRQLRVENQQRDEKINEIENRLLDVELRLQEIPATTLGSS